MERYKVLEAFIGERKVGTLALYKGRLVAFEYNEGWLREGFSISPFSLPLQKKVFIPNLSTGCSAPLPTAFPMAGAGFS